MFKLSHAEPVGSCVCQRSLKHSFSIRRCLSRQFRLALPLMWNWLEDWFLDRVRAVFFNRISNAKSSG